MRYADRRQAGEELATHLTRYARRSDVVVLGLVRGGVPVAAPVAIALATPLDVLVVRKLGVPWSPEVAFGAIGPGEVLVRNPDLIATLHPAAVARVIAAERAELSRREARYRSGTRPVTLDGRIALIVDDGLATGATARVAVGVARQQHARRVVVAVPVGAADALDLLSTEADEVVCPCVPAPSPPSATTTTSSTRLPTPT